ncbi:UNVERIFIED_CONTAM: hypothetical protein FKN15_012033, partial [Acipenser sinensis]
IAEDVGDEGEEEKECISYNISIDIHYGLKSNSLAFIKRTGVIDADKPISCQLRVLTLSEDSPYETLHSFISNAVAPFFKSYIKESGKADRDGDKMAPSVEKKIAELEMGLLHLQQNIEIPEISLLIHPIITNVAKQCYERGDKPKVTDFTDKVEDPTFLNQLQSGVNRWIREIQKVTKLDRDPASGTALQEISFWLNLERALNRIQEKRESPEVLLTLDILKHGKRFHATVSFDTDTGLKQAVETVNDYNPLMKDFPLNDLLSATELDKIRQALVAIFTHLRKIRNTKYPIQRALRLVEAISRDLSSQLLKVMVACFEVFQTWDDEYEKLQVLLRDIVKRKREENLKMVWRINPAHRKLQARLDHMRRFRRQHEQLRAVIVRVLRPQTQLIQRVKDDIESLHDKFKVQYPQSQSCKMSHVRDLPPVSGSIIWAKQIDRQLTAYMKRVEDVLGKGWENHVEGLKLKQDGDSFRMKLNTQEIFDDWARKVQQRNLGVSGRIFTIESTRARGRSGNVLKLKVNFLPEIITLSKEVRNLKWLGFRVPLAIVNKAHQANQLYPFAISLIESVRTYERTCEKVEERISISLLVAGLKKEVQALIAEGIALVWESYKLDPYVQRLAETVFNFQEKVDDLLIIEEKIDLEVRSLETCMYDHKTFTEILNRVQKAVDDLNLHSYSNLPIWVNKLDMEIERILGVRLQAGLKAWTQVLLGQMEDKADVDMDTDTPQVSHKPGGEPKIKNVVHELRITNQVIYLNPPIEDCRLCDEQLSSQSHYDFGLRALKSVLVSAGNVKRERIQKIKRETEERGEVVDEGDIAENLPEQEILIQSVCETMVPKLVAEDIPLLFSLLSDVFPGVPYHRGEMSALREELKKVCAEMYLTYGGGEDVGGMWVEKVLQLYQITQINHGLMMVGPSGSGKTMAWRVLLKALERLEGVEGVAHIIDPKAISKDHLYGTLDPNTREWTDGLFTHVLRKIIDNVRGELQKRQWIIFDGDVDPEWVENLNSVLDDNKLLTLPNGERLSLPPNVRIMFEVQDLKYATLATVSRCGMVWFSEDVLSTDMISNHFLARLRNIPLDEGEDEAQRMRKGTEEEGEEAASPMLQIQRDAAAIMQPYFTTTGLVIKALEHASKMEHIMDFTRLRCLGSLFSMCHQACRNVAQFNNMHHDFPMQIDQLERYIQRYLVYAILWSFSGDSRLKMRAELGEYIRRITTIPLPTAPNVPIIDYEVSITGEWQSWQAKVPQIEVETHKVAAPDVVVPTLDTVRHEALLYTWLAEHKPLVLCGPPGSGKTMTLFCALRALPDMEVVGLNFSSATTPELLLKTFDHYCEYRRTPNGVVLAPVQLGKWLVLFCDEINLPDMDKYGTQRVISFIRQMVEHGGFYRTSDQTWVKLERIQFVGACNPPTDPGRKPLTHRFLRHVPVVYVDYPGPASLTQIYGTFNRAMLRLIPSLRTYAEPLTAAMVEFYTMSQERFTQDIQPHYIYSPREMTRWVRGIFEALRPLETLAVEGLIRIWAHEALRLFQDRKYTGEDFDEDLRTVLRRSGCKNEKIAFIMDESNVLDSGFLERMNTLLANGEVPGLFEGDEYATLMTQCKEGAQKEGLMLDTHEELYKWFTSQVIRNLHVVFTMNPSSEGLKDRAATSPALFNRCVLNWFGDWSTEALYQVGKEFTSKMDLEKPNYVVPDYMPIVYDKLPQPPSHREAIVNSCVFVHQTLHQANNRLAKRGGRTMAITPRHYLDFINHYANLFNEKRSELEEQQMHLNVGLRKIKETVDQVEELRRDLRIKSQDLDVKNVAANDKLKKMVKDQQEAEKKKVMSQEIQESVYKQQEIIKDKQMKVKEDLDMVEPAVLEAQNAVSSIKKHHLVEVRAMANPPAAVKLALESICLLLGEETNDWKKIRQVIVRDNFITSIVNFVSEDLSDSIREKMKKNYMSNPSFNYELVNRASLACGPMVKWAIAQLNYADVLKRVEPLRNELQKLEDDAMENQSRAEEVEQMIRDLESSIARYKEEYAVLISEAQAIKADLAAVEAKVNRSTALLKSLSAERDRWEKTSETFKNQMSTIAGDCCLSAAFIAYAGYFDQQMRQNLFTTWSHHMQQANIQFRTDIARTEYLSNADERLRWQANSLPADDLCTENAIMLKRFNRLVIFIYKKRICVFQYGQLDVESYDPILNPVLNREVRRTGGRVLITLGDQDIDLSPSFVIFLSTRDPTVEFPPDLCSRVTFVNFTVTRSSLQSQCLNEVLKAERPDVDEKRSDLLKLQGEFQLRLRQLEKSLLQALNEVKGRILDDDTIITTLENLKKEAAEVTRKVEETDIVMQEVETVSQQYLTLSTACSSIYFTMEALNQCSLHLFLDIYHTVLYENTNLKGITDHTHRLSIITKDLFQIAFNRVARGMLHHDHITFAMLMARIYLKGINSEPSYDAEFQHFLRGKEIVLTGSSVPKVKELTSDQAEAMVRLSRLPAFKDLVSKVEADEQIFIWLESSSPEQTVPYLWTEEKPATPIGQAVHQLLLIQAFRPDRLLAVSHNFVAKVLGESFMAIIDQPLDLGSIVDSEGRQNISPDKIPWAALKTLMAQSIYGGRIDNEFDQRLLNTFLERIFTTGSFDSEFKLAFKVDGHKDIQMPDGIRREEFVHWVEMLPDTQTPSWLGLPSNAEKVLLTTQGILPRSWSRYTVPASMTVIQWVTDFSDRIKQLQQISQAAASGGAKELKNIHVCLGGLFVPEAYITATRQYVAQANSWSLEELCLEVNVTTSQNTVLDACSFGIKALTELLHFSTSPGLKLQGATCSNNKLSLSNSISTELPLTQLHWLKQTSTEKKANAVTLPVYLNFTRADLIFTVDFDIATKEGPHSFYERGVAVLCTE